MAGHADAFAFVLASARRTLEQVRTDQRLERPAEGRGAALATHVAAMLQLIATRINTTEAQFTTAHSESAKGALVRNLRLYTQLARAVHEALPWFERAGGTSLDLGTKYFIDEMASAIVGQGVETVSVADSTYMYSTLSWPFRITALDYFNVDVADGIRPIVLFFPLKEADSVLLHAIVAHELGHSAVDEYRLVQTVVEPLQDDVAFAEALSKAAKFIQTSLGVDSTAAERMARARLASWIEELLCDALALHYLGPSYLLSFSAFVLAASWTDPQASHPAPTLRIGMMIDQLTDLDWAPWLEKRFPGLWAWFLWVKATASPPMTPDNEFIQGVAVGQAQAVAVAARNRIDSKTYTPTIFTDDDKEARLDALLSRRILPVELDGAAVDRRNILLSGWSYALRTKPDGSVRVDGPAALAEALSEVSVQRFLGKALELSTVSETWAGLA